MRQFFTIIALACSLWRCGNETPSARDGAIRDDLAFDGGSLLDEAGPRDVDPLDASFDVDADDPGRADSGVFDTGVVEVCRLDDGDVLAPLPIAHETTLCAMGTDVADPLFSLSGALPSEYGALHQLCTNMDPTPLTLEHVTNATLASAIDDFLRVMATRPAVERVLAAVGTSTSARLAALRRVWLDQNGFEHVLCGDINPNGTVGGLHLWSEYHLAELEGRADYLCTVEGIDDPDVATIRFRWIPPRRNDPLLKPIGGFHVGMSPACLLAIGFYAVNTGIMPLPGAQPAFEVGVYGQPVSFAIGIREGAIVTIFPTADPR